MKIANELGLDMTNIILDRVQRPGNSKNTNKPLIAGFALYKDRQAVLKEREGI